MLYQEFLSKFPPSDSGEFTEKDGDTIKVTWMMFKEFNQETIPAHAELNIDLSSLELGFSLEMPQGKQTGYAVVLNDLVCFKDKSSENLFPSFIENIQSWNNMKKTILQ